VSERPLVSVAVVSWQSRDEVLACLASLEAHAPIPLQVVVVDNASTDGTVDAVRSGHPAAQVIANAENVGFARASNQAWRVTASPLVLFLNPDAEVGPGALETLVETLEARPELGVVAPRVVGPDGSVEVSTGPDLDPRSEWKQRRLVHGVARRDPGALREAEARHSVPREPDWVSGACFLARRAALEAVSGFDEAFFLYEEDADLCRRLRGAGWRIAFEPRATIRHRKGVSMARGPERARLEYHRSHLLYYRKYNGPLARLLLRSSILARGLASLLRPGRGTEGRRLVALAFATPGTPNRATFPE